MGLAMAARTLARAAWGQLGALMPLISSVREASAQTRTVQGSLF